MPKNLISAPAEAKSMVSGRASKEDKNNRGELQGVSIRPAENGYYVRCSFDPKDPKKGYPDDEEMVYNSLSDALDYAESVLKEHEGYEKSEK